MILHRIPLAKCGSAQSDFLEDVNRIMDAAKAEGVLLRLLGTLAFHKYYPQFSYIQEILERKERGTEMSMNAPVTSQKRITY